MDRESAITILKSFYLFNPPPLEYMINIIRIYLMEKGYEMGKIDAAITYLTLTGPIYGITGAIVEHYERKFNICKLWSVPNPLNNQGQERKVILIF